MDKEIFRILARIDDKELDYYIKKGILSLTESDFIKMEEDDNYDKSLVEENLHIVKSINILKYLEFNMSEIEALHFNNYDSLEEALNAKMLTYTKDTYDADKKKEILGVLSVSGLDKKLIEHYADGLSKNKKGKVKNTETIFDGSGYLLLYSFLVSILMIDIVTIIHNDGWNEIVVKSLCALGVLIYCINGWKKYITNYKKYKAIQKYVNRQKYRHIPWVIMYVVFIIISLSLYKIAPVFWMSSDVYMYQTDYKTDKIFAISLFVWGFAVQHVVAKKEDINSRLKQALIIVWICMVSVIISVLLSYNLTAVTKDKIIIYSTFNVKGTKYKYTDVDCIETSFGKKDISLTRWKRKGEFSYIITLNDKKVVFIEPIENDDIERYEDLEYVALEEFDAKLVELGIKKIGNDKYSNCCNEIDSIVERYIRIVNNK